MAQVDGADSSRTPLDGAHATAHHDAEAGSSRAVPAPPLTHHSEEGSSQAALFEVSDEKRDEDVVVTVTVGRG